MPVIPGDFTGISSNFEPLGEGEQIFEVVEIIDQGEDDDWKAKNATTGKNPAIVIRSEVVEGDRVGANFSDYIYTKTKAGKVNKQGLGKIKAYAEAILGKEEANTPNGMDTDKFIGGRFRGYVKARKYIDAGVEKDSTEMAKILPV